MRTLLPGHWSSGMILLQGRRGRGFNSLMPPVLDFLKRGILGEKDFCPEAGFRGWLAEWSKALVQGTSLFGGESSNLSPIIFMFGWGGVKSM